jgi:hypothetical protein
MARILILVAALLMTACSGVTITPPDFSCHAAGMESMNGQSGCSDAGGEFTR